MKRTLSLLVLLGATLLLLTGCWGKGDKPKKPESNELANVLFATTITNPEGNSGSVYLQGIPDLTNGKYDNSNSIQSGFGTPPIAFPNGHIYTFPDYMGSDKAQIKLYERAANNRFTLKGILSLPAKGAACNIVEVSNQKAYVSLQGLGLVIAFNPTTMKETARIDLNSLAHKGVTVSNGTMLLRGTQLFVALSQYNAQWMPEENSVEIALIDTTTDKYVKTIRNDRLGVSSPSRPIDKNSMFLDEKGDMYISCIASFGFIPNLPGGIIRIKKGETEIDPTYCLRLDQVKIEGAPVECHAEFISSIYYGGNGKAYAYANANSLAPEGSNNPYTIISNIAVEIDLNAKTIKAIKGLPLSNPQGIALGKYKNLIVFGSANKENNGFFTYNPATKEVKGPVVQVQGWPLFFYSFK